MKGAQDQSGTVAPALLAVFVMGAEQSMQGRLSLRDLEALAAALT